MAKKNESVVRQCIEFIQKHLTEKLSIEVVAKNAGYSASWIEKKFIEATGEGIFTHIQRLRMEKAKQLLRESQLGISETAYEAGYESHAGFTAAFTRLAGVSPSQYRKKTAQPAHKESLEKDQVWFKDLMEGTAMKPWWSPAAGQWHQRNGSIGGFHDDNAEIILTRPLPENFRVSCEIFQSAKYEIRIPFLSIVLKDESGQQVYAFMGIGEGNAPVGSVRRFGRLVTTMPLKNHKVDAWRKLEICSMDDSITVSLDGEDVLCFRDPFPPSYELRCKLGFGLWRGLLRIRNVTIRNLGIPSLAPVIRQGDALYNAGLFDKAFKFYDRLQTSDAGKGLDMELPYKKGMCQMAQGLYGEAREWISKAAVLGNSDFWGRNAVLALFELDAKEGRLNSFRDGIGSLLVKPELAEQTRTIVMAVCEDLENRGFREQALQLRQEILDHEVKGSLGHLTALRIMGNSLLELNRFERARTYFGKVVDAGEYGVTPDAETWFGILDAHLHAGQTEEVKGVLDRIRKQCTGTSVLARALYYEGLLHRAEGSFERACETLTGVISRYPDAPNFGVFALLNVALILCTLGKPDEGRAVLQRVQETAAWHPSIMPGQRSRFFYPPAFVEGDFAEAARILEQDIKAEGNTISAHAEQMLKAGILLELSNQHEAAMATWSRLSRMYPPLRCSHYSLLAQEMISLSESGVVNKEILREMPYPVRIRSEIFFLSGLLAERKDLAETTRELFRTSAEEDRTKEWPAVLAAKKLSR